MERGRIIKLPHLKARVFVRDKVKGDRDHADAYVERRNVGEYRITIPLPVKGRKPEATLVHEIIHVLRCLVEDHEMYFEKESEHMAYIAGYLFEEICKM